MSAIIQTRHGQVATIGAARWAYNNISCVEIKLAPAFEKQLYRALCSGLKQAGLLMTEPGHDEDLGFPVITVDGTLHEISSRCVEILEQALEEPLLLGVTGVKPGISVSVP